MVATSVEGRQLTYTDEILDLARSLADRSADPDATYESFLLGLELGMARSPLDEALDLEATRTTRIVIEGPDYSQEDRIISDPFKPMIRKAPAPRFVSSADFPTEWTLDQ